MTELLLVCRRLGHQRNAYLLEQSIKQIGSAYPWNLYPRPEMVTISSDFFGVRSNFCRKLET
jgi:hypothetical protein